MVCTLNFHVMSRQGCVQIIMFWSVIVMVFVQKMALLYLINFVTSNLSFVSVTNLLVPALLANKLVIFKGLPSRSEVDAFIRGFREQQRSAAA